MAIVITHPERGIFVGLGMGLAFWSRWDAADQDRVATFADVAQARDHVAAWEGDDPADAFGYVDVPVGDVSPEPYATVAKLTEAGLGDMLGELACTHLVPGHG